MEEKHYDYVPEKGLEDHPKGISLEQMEVFIKKMKEFGLGWEFDEGEGIAFSCEYKIAEWEPDDIDWFTKEISKFEKFDWLTPGISTKRTVELLIAKA